MHRLIHRRSRSAAVDDESSLVTTRSGVTEADIVDPDSTSTPLQAVNMPDEIEVSGGNKKTYRNSSRSQPKQRSLAASTRGLTVQNNGSGSASIRGSNRTNIHRFEPVRSSRRAMKRGDDSESSVSDSDSFTSSVEDEENENVADISDSTSTSSNDLDDDDDDSDGELHDSLDDEKDQSADEAGEQRQDAPVVKKATKNTHLAPVLSFSGVPGMDPQIRRLTSASNLKLQRASQTGREVIYVRVPHSTSADVQRRLNRQLRNEYPGTLIVLDDSPTKTPFVDRTSFSLLWQRIQDGRVDCIWIPRGSHISKSKEAFQMFEWMCDEHRVPILILPTLETAIKTARTSV